MNIILALALAAAPPAAGTTASAATVDKEIAVTADRLSRGALKAEARQYLRAAMADPRSGQNARWFTPVCTEVLGITPELGAIFTSRIADVARHVGLPPARKGCEVNVALVFTREPVALVQAIDKRQGGAFDSLPKPERRLLTTPGLPVRWWHFTRPEASDGRQFGPGGPGGASLVGGDATYNNNAVATRIGLPTRVGITGAVVVVDIGQLGTVSMAALSDHVAMAVMARLRLDPTGRPQPSIMGLFDAGAPKAAGFTPQDEAFLEALYRSDAAQESRQQRGQMVGVMADSLLEAAKPAAPAPAPAAPKP